VGNHMADLPELTHAVKFAAVADSSREGLTDAWKQWIQAAGARSSHPCFQCLPCWCCRTTHQMRRRTRACDYP